MTDLIPSIGMIADLARDAVEKKKYLRNFYDKAASIMVARFTNAIVKSRPIKEAGAQQVRLDWFIVISDVVTLSASSATSGPSSFQSYSLETTWAPGRGRI